LQFGICISFIITSLSKPHIIWHHENLKIEVQQQRQNEENLKKRKTKGTHDHNYIFLEAYPAIAITTTKWACNLYLLVCSLRVPKHYFKIKFKLQTKS